MAPDAACARATAAAMAADPWWGSRGQGCASQRGTLGCLSRRRARSFGDPPSGTWGGYQRRRSTALATGADAADRATRSCVGMAIDRSVGPLSTAARTYLAVNGPFSKFV